jgi:hypothetical protein
MFLLMPFHPKRYFRPWIFSANVLVVFTKKVQAISSLVFLQGPTKKTDRFPIPKHLHSFDEDFAHQ